MVTMVERLRSSVGVQVDLIQIRVQGHFQEVTACFSLSTLDNRCSASDERFTVEELMDQNNQQLLCSFDFTFIIAHPNQFFVEKMKARPEQGSFVEEVLFIPNLAELISNVHGTTGYSKFIGAC